MKMYGFASVTKFYCLCFGKKGWYFKLIWSPVKKQFVYDPEDMPECPELSEKGFKILVGVGIACVLGLIGIYVYIFCFL